MESTNGGDRGGHLLFLSSVSGYELLERDGEPPQLVTTVVEGERTYRVAKVAPSPLPGDRRACVYLQPA